MKNILITDSLHTRVKLEATRCQMTIQDWTARVLGAALDEAADRRLVDTRTEYVVPITQTEAMAELEGDDNA